ncbi:hypothetical protein Y882_11645 [Dyella japonica DSM 16301]|uniref:Uncharacterized protein n=1 Tax=Dyella japonica DSM 16301 TaxID=1440762 RepID=A0A0G9H0R2_9GAMM|nr:hypothetical protein Y882_11645 [Dyella japonica DSM 16301]
MLSIGAGIMELGIPIALVWLTSTSPRWRPQAVVVLGALAPLLTVLVVGCIVGLFVSPLDRTSLAYLFAIPIVAFEFYATTALLGTAISILPRPVGTWARFALGMAAAPLACGAIVLFAGR